MKSQSNWRSQRLVVISLSVILGAVLYVYIGWAVPRLHAQTSVQEINQSLDLLPTADTYIVQGEPERRRPDLRVIWTGYNQSQGLLEQRSLLRFSLADLPATGQITSAQLALHLSSTTTGDDALTISVRQLQGDWAEEINWQEMEAALSSATIQIVGEAVTNSVGTEFIQYNWDVTSLLQNWQANSGNIESISFLLQSEATTTERERAFWSRNCSDSDCGTTPGKRPLLTIDYTEPTPTPTPSPTSRPTAIATKIPAQPTPGLDMLIAYRRGAEPQTAQIPDGWLPGELLDVELTLSRVNSTQAVTGVDIGTSLPTGAELVSIGQSGSHDERRDIVSWADVTVPGSGSETVSYRLQKPVLITQPRMVYTQTAASTIVIFDASVQTGSDLTVLWDLGDGTPTITRPDSIFQTYRVQHDFGAPGQYQVKLWLYNKACLFSLSEVVTVPAAEASSIHAASQVVHKIAPKTDGTTTLPWCPETVVPSAPTVVVKWREGEEERVRFGNPNQLYLPNVTNGP